MADTSVKLSGTYDSIEAYNILEEMRNMSSDYEEIRTEAAAAASAATAAVTTAQTAANSASTYAGNAQTYAGNANTSAGEAAGYASDASTAANNAASSETNAHNSEVAAAASASSAAASEAVVAGALPLTGGTMTGSIVNNTGTDGIILGESGNTGNVSMSGGEALAAHNGAKLDLFGASHATNPGEAILQAGNANGYKQLRCKPNGVITWGGDNVLTDGFVGNIVSNYAEDKSVSASTSVTITTVSLPKGVWVVTGHVVFDTVSGRNYGATVTDSQYFTYGYDGSVSVAPGSNQAIALQPVRIFNLSKTTTIYLNVYTVGGTTIAKNNILTAVRIA